MAFIGRERELETLNNLYNRDGFQMLVLYGRRRVGKSTLLKEFIKDKKAVYYTAIQDSVSSNLEMFAKSIRETFNDARYANFNSIEALFSALGELCSDDRIVVIIDEFPYLAESDSSILSVIQKHIDNEWQNGNMFFILCGSSISFMENKVLSEKSPLFGRRTSQLKLRPLDYIQSALFTPEYSYEDKALCYGFTGGIPKYLSLIDPKLSVYNNIIRLFFREDGYLFEEPQNLISQEYKNVALYSSIINAIANGASKFSDICNETGLSATTTTRALNELISTEIIEKQTAITEENNKKKALYTIKDGLFRFWYRFLPDAISLINLGKGDKYFVEIVDDLNDFMGSVFEDMCRYFVLNIGIDKKLNSTITEVGKWWGTNPRTHEQTDIDVVALNHRKKEAILGECKYRNSLLDKKVLDALREREGLIDKRYRTVQYLLFSKTGFSDYVIEQCKDGVINTFTLSDIYEMI